MQLFRTWLPKLQHILLKSHNIRYKEQHPLPHGERLAVENVIRLSAQQVKKHRII